MKRTVALLGLALLAFSANASALEAVSGKVYKGGNGVKVTIVRLKPLSDKKALIEISGSDTESDGKIVLHEIEEYDGKADYFIKKKKGSKTEKYVTIAMRNGSFEVYPPGGGNDGIRIAFDDKKSEELKVDDLLRRYTPDKK